MPWIQKDRCLRVDYFSVPLSLHSALSYLDNGEKLVHDGQYTKHEYREMPRELDLLLTLFDCKKMCVMDADWNAFVQFLKSTLIDRLESLTPREEKVLKLRFGIEDGRIRTLDEVGYEFNLTRERIRQVEAKAFCKLSASDYPRYLKKYIFSLGNKRLGWSGSEVDAPMEDPITFFKICVVEIKDIPSGENVLARRLVCNDEDIGFDLARMDAFECEM